MRCSRWVLLAACLSPVCVCVRVCMRTPVGSEGLVTVIGWLMCVMWLRVCSVYVSHVRPVFSVGAGGVCGWGCAGLELAAVCGVWLTVGGGARGWERRVS